MFTSQPYSSSAILETSLSSLSLLSLLEHAVLRCLYKRAAGTHRMLAMIEVLISGHAVGPYASAGEVSGLQGQADRRTHNGDETTAYQVHLPLSVDEGALILFG